MISSARPLTIDYRDPRHAELPHVVKFSGGLSSAALALSLAEQGWLRPERGDLALFANTSAEHPGTYAFAAECCDRLEAEHGLPCFWYEFCTVEDANSRGLYRRRQSYRLVARRPLETDPNGYRSSGEVFEEMLSWQGILPNPHSRSCTAKLKLYPSHLLLAEWLGGADGPQHDGHYGEQPQLTAQAAWRQHRKHGGGQSQETHERRVAYMTQRPPSRPRQRWDDYTAAPMATRFSFIPPVGRAKLWGGGGRIAALSSSPCWACAAMKSDESIGF